MSESPRSQTLEAAPVSPSDRDTQDAPAANPDLDMDISDNERDLESDLSEVDEAEFEDFDPNAIAIDERPRVDLDEDVVRTLTAKKKKRGDGDAAPKKPKEGKRAKKKRDDDNDGADGEIMRGKRKSKGLGVQRSSGDAKERAKERRAQAVRDEQANEEQMTPEERRRKALDKAMDAALKNPNKRRKKKDEVDLEDAADDEIAALKVRMEESCQRDNDARDRGEPAIHKLKMLPEVVAIMNRNTAQHTIVDPDTNFLQAVKFFLEPLNDGSLPAYSIQRDLFNSLSRLPIEKEALRSSGIGKLMIYYTKSKRPEVGIKRIAERLVNDWSRPILKQSDDYKKRKIETREFDAQATRLAHRPSTQASQSQSSQPPQLSQRDRERERILAPNRTSNRARLDASAVSYSVAPKSSYIPGRVDPGSRPIGAGGDAAFREMLGKKAKRS